MTLNEKINDALFYIEPKVSIIKCEQIVEDFAIEFIEWVIENKILSSKMPAKELLEIYKKTL